MTPIAWIKLAVLVALLAVIGWKIHSYGEERYSEGEAHIQSKWDAEVEANEQAVRKLQAAANRVSTKIVTVYVDRVQVIREKSDAIVRQVPVYVPAGLPLLPGGFRLSLDAAAANEPIPIGTRSADAAPVAPQVAAASIVGNYGSAHETAERLIQLQDWVYAQCRNNPPPEGCVAPYAAGEAKP